MTIFCFIIYLDSLNILDFKYIKKSSIENLFSLILTANRLIREETAGKKRTDPFSLIQFKVLSLIVKNDLSTMKDVADALFITFPSATAIIDRLVGAGQLKRFVDTSDRRKVRLEITYKGKKIFKTQRKMIIEKISKILRKLNAKEKTELKNILNKIINSYRR